MNGKIIKYFTLSGLGLAGLASTSATCSDQPKCVDLNCSHACYVSNDQARCACPKNYVFENGSNTNCVLDDSDPCFDNLCSHACFVNQDGRAQCACPNGLELGLDSWTCLDEGDLEKQLDRFQVTDSPDGFLRTEHGWWMTSDRKHCVEVVKADGSDTVDLSNPNKHALKLNACDVSNPYQRFKYDTTNQYIQLKESSLNANNYCLYSGSEKTSHPRHKNYIKQRKVYFQTCNPASTSFKFTWNYEFGQITTFTGDSPVCIIFDDDLSGYSVNSQVCNLDANFLDPEDVGFVQL